MGAATGMGIGEAAGRREKRGVNNMKPEILMMLIMV